MGHPIIKTYYGTPYHKTYYGTPYHKTYSGTPYHKKIHHLAIRILYKSFYEYFCRLEYLLFTFIIFFHSCHSFLLILILKILLFYLRNLKYAHLTPIFRLHNIHLVFSTHQHKHKWILCTEKPVLNGSFQDF